MRNNRRLKEKERESGSEEEDKRVHEGKEVGEIKKKGRGKRVRMEGKEYEAKERGRR